MYALMHTLMRTHTHTQHPAIPLISQEHAHTQCTYKSCWSSAAILPICPSMASQGVQLLFHFLKNVRDWILEPCSYTLSVTWPFSQMSSHNSTSLDIMSLPCIFPTLHILTPAIVLEGNLPATTHTHRHTPGSLTFNLFGKLDSL